MALAPGDAPEIAWQRIGLRADLSGTLAQPQGQASLELDGLRAGELTLERLTATAAGDPVRLSMDAELVGLRAKGLPESAATVPLRIAGELTANDPALPFRLTARHPLLDLAVAGGLAARAGQATLSLPDLAGTGRREWAGPGRARALRPQGRRGWRAPFRPDR